MKLLRYLFVGPVLAALALSGAGCRTHSSTEALGNGYEVVTHPDHPLNDEPGPPRLELQYRATNDVVTPIWPSLDDPKAIIKGDLAVFVAERAFIEPERVTHPRLFAVRWPDVPLDLTDEVLWRWSKANGKSFPKTLDKLASLTADENEDRLELHLDFWTSQALGAEREDWPDDGTLQLDWRQVDEIMHAVKAKGIPEKDLRWKTPYIGEKY